MSRRSLVVAIGILGPSPRAHRANGRLATWIRLASWPPEPGNWLTHGRTYGEPPVRPSTVRRGSKTKRMGASAEALREDLT